MWEIIFIVEEIGFVVVGESRFRFFDRRVEGERRGGFWVVFFEMFLECFNFGFLMFCECFGCFVWG